MISDTRRLLGFAFANADLLLEIDASGRILFAAGAIAEVAGAAELTGADVKALFLGPDGLRFAAEARILPCGARRSLRLRLAGKSEVTVALFHLPDYDGRISCTVALSHQPEVTPLKDQKTGLATTEGFLAAVARTASPHDALTLVKVPALPKLCAAMPVEKADALLAAIGKCLAESGAKAAGRLSDTSFAAVADAKDGSKSQIAGLRAAMSQSGLPPTEIQETHVGMQGVLRPEQRLLALRYVVEHFATGLRNAGPLNDMGQAFNTMMDETQERLCKLSDTVSAGDFALAYQPIVDLKTRVLSHFEALARFSRGDTGETIQFVEKLGIADSFDLAVVMKVITALQADKAHDAHVAFNISGDTIQSPAAFAMLVGILERHRKLAPRLLIEITETAQISDLGAAAKGIDTLRALGYRVGLDDFGSGAATLNYLHAFNLDFVKFDGSLVKKLGASPRDDALLSAMLKVCHELGFTTIAECLESEDDIARAKRAGFDHGQGYVFGAAGRIPAGAGRETPRLRRKGMQETWQ